jgi:hypothetical protein
MKTIVHGLCAVENMPREMEIAIENGVLTVWIHNPGGVNGQKIRIVQPAERSKLEDFFGQALAELGRLGR